MSIFGVFDPDLGFRADWQPLDELLDVFQAFLATVTLGIGNLE